MAELLSAENVGAYVVGRGIFRQATGLEIAELPGGVSGAVFVVHGEGKRVVVKQALERFLVADEWLVPRERVLAEAEALELMASLAPGSVPEVVAVDSETFTLVMEQAPESWRPWKSLLLEGEADPAVGQRLGELLAVVHSAGDDIGSAESFEAQRVDPYLRTIMRRHPEHAPAIATYVERLLATRRCLVHGDYSPKNVLVGGGGLWVIDWEVAHRGDAAFDLAFMLNHLLLKTIHRPPAREAYEACGRAFCDAYALPYDPRYVLGLVGCLMLARVDGKSPAEYLTEDDREHARAGGISLLTEPPGSLGEAWALIARGPPG